MESQNDPPDRTKSTGGVASASLSVSALVVSLLAFFFGGYFNAAWEVSINERSIVPSIDVVQHQTITPQEQEIEIPTALQQRSREARYFENLPPGTTRRELEEARERITSMDFRSAATSLRTIVDELSREDITPQDTVRVWSQCECA